jgi:hypothetical protein
MKRIEDNRTTLSGGMRGQANTVELITREIPRLCRGGSRSLTFRAVAHRGDFQS